MIALHIDPKEFERILLPFLACLRPYAARYGRRSSAH